MYNKADSQVDDAQVMMTILRKVFVAAIFHAASQWYLKVLMVMLKKLQILF